MKTNKIIKSLKKNNTPEQNKKMETCKKICLLKRQNRSLTKTIHIINFCYYILAIAFSFPMQLRIMEMIDEISNLSNHVAILLMCMMVYYMMAIGFYYLSTYSIVKSIEDKISCNTESINMLKYREQKEIYEIMESVKANKLFDSIKDI